ncbi:hypothetical protein KVV02_004839 [Mortierella alpina]|uniref:Nucleotide-sugar transporter n=1 Tax=Mortierella alpina TaxID=64518 RepID=A0A9P8CYJ5_MORAP|nr:hypothetical protein KVV02_004839 [Mortierella alpina]
MGLTFLLGFLLCIFQSSESILVKLAGNRPDPHPSSAKLLFLSELLKLLISYTLLSVERKQLWGISNLFRRRCCRGASSASATCCRNNSSSNTAYGHHHQPIPLQDEEEQQSRGKRLLSNNGDAADYDDEEEEGEGDYARKHPSPSFSSSSSSAAASSSSGSSCSVPPILLFAVPGAIYFFNNNLTFILLSLMPAPTYVVLSNLKILTTGLFSFLFLHRLLTTVQWISLGILFLSTAVSQIDLEKGLSLSISLQAFLLMILFCSLSAAASVFSEYVMKERFATESIHLQNMKLYMFGILFNGITYLLTPPPPPTTAGTGATGFFADMAAIHFMIILAYALLGLVTSAIIKFSGSITKVYASSMSMFFAALVSWLLLNDQLTVLFFVGCFGCCYALHLYYRVGPSTTATATTTHGSAEDADEEERRRIAGAAAATTGRRDSTSSTTSSTTLAASSPVSAKNNNGKLQNGVPLSSVRVVDRNEYLSLDMLDGDVHDEEEDEHQERAPPARR